MSLPNSRLNLNSLTQKCKKPRINQKLFESMEESEEGSSQSVDKQADIDFGFARKSKVDLFKIADLAKMKLNEGEQEIQHSGKASTAAETNGSLMMNSRLSGDTVRVQDLSQAAPAEPTTTRRLKLFGVQAGKEKSDQLKKKCISELKPLMKPDAKIQVEDDVGSPEVNQAPVFQNPEAQISQV